jgi:hypothetical protein
VVARETASRAARALRLYRVLLPISILESAIHYTDNTLRYDDYTGPNSTSDVLIKPWVIPVSWVLFTAAGIVGYRRLRDGRTREAAAWIGVYSVSGLISLLHYTEISIADLSVFQNTFVFLDIVLGLLLLALALVLSTSEETPRGLIRGQA